jgi:hypothetical protein
MSERWPIVIARTVHSVEGGAWSVLAMLRTGLTERIELGCVVGRTLIPSVHAGFEDSQQSEWPREESNLRTRIRALDPPYDG